MNMPILQSNLFMAHHYNITIIAIDSTFSCGVLIETVPLTKKMVWRICLLEGKLQDENTV